MSTEIVGIGPDGKPKIARLNAAGELIVSLTAGTITIGEVRIEDPVSGNPARVLPSDPAGTEEALVVREVYGKAIKDQIAKFTFVGTGGDELKVAATFVAPSGIGILDSSDVRIDPATEGGNLADIKTAVETVATASANLDVALSTLAKETTLGDVKTAVETVATASANLDVALSTLAKETTLGDVKTAVETVATASANLDVALSTLAKETTLGDVKTAVETVATASANLDVALSTLAKETTLGDVKTAVETVATASANLDVALSTLAKETTLGDVKTAVETVATASANLDVALSTLAKETTLGDVKTATESVADCVETDRLGVNPISGKVGVAAGAGAVGDTVQRTTLASDDPAVAHLSSIKSTDGIKKITDALPGGTNLIGRVNDEPQAANGCDSTSFIGANSDNAGVAKASAGNVYGIVCFNKNASPVYLKIYNKATTPTNGDTPKKRYMIPGNTAGAGFVIVHPKGVYCSAGISYRLVAGMADNDNTSVSASEQLVNIDFK